MRKWTVGKWMVALGCTACFAAGTPKGGGGKATTRPATVVLAANDAALTAAVDTDVIAEGDVVASAWSKSGKVLNIVMAGPDGKKPPAGTGLGPIVFVADRPAFDAAFSGDVAKAVEGAHIRVMGRLQAYGGYDKKMVGSKQIVLTKVDQLEILVSAVAPPGAAATMPATRP